MTKVLFVFFMLFFGATVLGQDNDVARVSKIEGVEVYIMAEPVRDYEVLCDVNTGIKATSIVTSGLVNESIADKVSQFVRRALKENSKIDAVIYSSGKRIVGVRFKDEANVNNKGLAHVKKIDGVPVFVMNEPLSDYEVMGSKGGGIKWKSYLTGGLVNNSIEEDIEKFTRKITEDNRSVDGVIYTAGKRASGIMFKKK